MGQNGNSIVSKMIGYVDMWFSSDGATWYQVGHATCSKYSTLEHEISHTLCFDIELAIS